jgi:hypothetical protein
VFGSDQWCDTIEGMIELQNKIVQSVSSGPDAAEEMFSKLTKEDISRIRIPDTVFGFRIADDENAKLQLDALEGILRLGGMQMEEAQQFLERLKRNDLPDGQTLSLTLDPGMIPLEDMQGDQQQVAAKIVELLEGRKFTFALGVKSKMMLIAFGEASTLIDSVGEDGDKLIDHPALKVLTDQPPESLRSIGYASERWVESQWNANFGKYFQNLAGQFSAALNSEAEKIPDLAEWKQDIQRDAAWMDSKINQLIPEFGPILSWTHAIPGGTEGYSYNWSKNVVWENGQPLNITDHAGQTPLMLLAFKQRKVEVIDEICEYMLANLQSHVKRFIAVAEEDDQERETALKVVERAWPLLEEVHAIFQEKITPSLGSNESLFSFSADWLLTQLPNMPPPPKPLPLPEFALACGVSDRELFLEGCGEMYDLFDRAVDLVREFEPDSVPADYSVPRPEQESVGEVTKYTYDELTNALAVPGFEPQLVLGEDFLLLGYSQQQIEAMSEERLLETRPVWLTPETPVAAVSYFDFAGVVEAIRPWAEFGLTMNFGSLDQPVTAASGPVPTGNDILQIWDCLTSLGQVAGTATVKEDGAVVSRWVWIEE